MNASEGKRLSHVRNLESEFCQTEPVLRLGDALQSGDLADVTFLVGENEIPIKGHKLILALGSKVFYAMFYGGMKESNSESVPVPDIEPEAFRLLLKYIYTEEIYLKNVQHSVLTSVLYATRKYDVEKLESILIKSFESLVNEETAISFLRLAIFYDLKSLEAKCFECIDVNADRIVFSDNFINSDIETVCLLLKRDSLIISEIKLFNAITRWASLECERKEISSSDSSNIRSTLGEALELIRYSTMSPKDFANGPATSGVLSDSEVANVFLSLFSFDPPKQLFPSNKRQSTWRTSSYCLCIGFSCTFCDKIKMTFTGSPWKNVQLFNITTGTTTPCTSPTPARYCSCRTRGYCPEKHGYVR